MHIRLDRRRHQETSRHPPEVNIQEMRRMIDLPDVGGIEGEALGITVGASVVALVMLTRKNACCGSEGQMQAASACQEGWGCVSKSVRGKGVSKCAVAVSGMSKRDVAVSKGRNIYIRRKAMMSTDRRWAMSDGGQMGKATTNLISQIRSDGDGVGGVCGSEGRNRGGSGQLGEILWCRSCTIHFPTTETINGVRLTRGDACDGQCQSLRSSTQK